jgi:drug/metabolite transporter (DMT)-like permease
MSASSLIASPIRSIGPAPALGIAMRRGIAFGLVAALIWGSYMAISNHGIEAGLRPADLAFIRYAVAGLLLLPWLARHVPLHLGGIGWRKGLTLSLFAGPLFVLVGTSGYRFAPLAHGAVIQLGALTVASVLLASALIGERAGRHRLAGLSVIIAGLGVTAGPSLFAGGSTAWIGDLLFVAAGIMWALFTVLQRRWAIDPMAATAVVSVVSAAIYVPLYLSSQGLTRIAATNSAMLAEQILVQGVLSGVIAMFAFSRAVQDLGAGRAALFPTLAPAIAILAGIPLGGGVPTVFQAVGLLILSIGMLIAVIGSPLAFRKI